MESSLSRKTVELQIGPIRSASSVHSASVARLRWIGPRYRQHEIRSTPEKHTHRCRTVNARRLMSAGEVCGVVDGPYRHPAVRPGVHNGHSGRVEVEPVKEGVSGGEGIPQTQLVRSVVRDNHDSHVLVTFSLLGI